MKYEYAFVVFLVTYIILSTIESREHFEKEINNNHIDDNIDYNIDDMLADKHIKPIEKSVLYEDVIDTTKVGTQINKKNTGIDRYFDEGNLIIYRSKRVMKEFKNDMNLSAQEQFEKKHNYVWNKLE